MNYVKSSGYEPAIRLEKVFPLSFSRRIAFVLVMVLLVLGVLILILGFVKLIGIAKLFAAASIIFLVYSLFLSFLKEGKYTPSEFTGVILDFTSAFALDTAVIGDSLDSKKFLLFLLKRHQFRWMLMRLDIPKDEFAKKVSEKYATQSLIEIDVIMRQALVFASQRKSVEVSLAFLLPALLKLDKNFYDLMFEYDVSEEDLLQVALWMDKSQRNLREAMKFWNPKKMTRVKGVGKNWSAGFTPNLDKVGHDLTEVVAIHKPAHIYGHQKYIEQIEQFLVDGTHNALLVGSPGVGRHAVVNNLAMLMNAGDVLRPLQYQRLVQIDTSAVLTSSVSHGSNIDKINLLFSEALWAGNIVLVINDVDAFFDSKNEVGRLNATEAILPFLKSRLKIIGLTTQTGYQTTIGKNPELQRWFGKIEVIEPDFDETLSILEDHVPAIERGSRLVFTYQALKEIVTLSTRLIQTLPNPEKSLEVLESTAIYAKTKGSGKTILPEHVQKVITQRTKIPVEQITGQEKDKLLNLEHLLHERIIGQDEAVTQIANALKRARSGIGSQKRPIGSFLFLGPTGVGKTETTKALASIYFGSEERIIRMDMSEFQEIHALNRIIGDKDQNEGGLLTEAVIANPFSIILLDEIEKAHPKILDLFLQVLDEGRLTDAMNRTVDFTNTMIIATSNAGAELIRESLKSGMLSKDQVLDYVQKKQLFRPEFLNRFDGVIIFKPLTPSQLLNVAELLINDLNHRLDAKEVRVVVTPELLAYIIKNAYSPEYGARPLRRFISEHIENYIAQGLIESSIKRGDKIEFTPEAIKKL